MAFDALSQRLGVGCDPKLSVLGGADDQLTSVQRRIKPDILSRIKKAAS